MCYFIKEMDYFGYTPQFLILGENQFKTRLGGLIFLLFVLFAIYYAGIGFINFLNNQNVVDSSRDLRKPSGNFTIDTSNFYFGVGLVNNDYLEYNLTDFPYKFSFTIMSLNRNGKISKSTIHASKCNLSLFINTENRDVYSEEDLKFLKNKVEKYYLCPDKNFKLLFNPKLFASNINYFQFYVDINSKSNLELAKNKIRQLKPKISVIYKNIFIDTENKYHPFYKYIDSYWSGLDYETSKKTEFSLDPFEILDDDKMFQNTKFYPVKTNISNQQNGTIFPISIKSNRFDNYFNRTEKTILALFRGSIYLNPELKQTLRSYRKFAAFLAEVTSILSNILMIFAIIMMKYNSVQGKNNMILSLFSNKSIKNLKLFKDDLKPIFEERKTNNLSRETESLRKNCEQSKLYLL